MTWEQLTQEQRDVYLVFERDLRALAGETQRLFSKFSALKSRKTGQIDAILVDLDNNTIVPNSSGLAGSQGLDSDADMLQIFSDFDNMLTNHDTTAKRERRAKAAGQANI